MWEKIIKLIKKSGGKFIIVENDEPTFVILPVDEYENLIDGQQVEQVNREIIELKSAENSEPQVGIEDIKDEKEELKIEDLPF